MSLSSAIYAVDLVGTASFALSGALRAVDRRPDFVGMLILATSAAVGGGVLRDVVLKRDILFLHDIGYPLVVLAAVAAVCIFPFQFSKRERTFRYFDAIGLGVFTASTAAVTWHTPGVNALSVLFVATVTGCAGGVVRDLLIDKPTLVLANELYVTPAILGAGALMIAERCRAPQPAPFVVAMLVTTALRVCAIRFDWRLPRIPAIHPAPEPSTTTDQGQRTTEP
jgi:uncharacterized membrane protein YeiH